MVIMVVDLYIDSTFNGASTTCKGPVLGPGNATVNKRPKTSLLPWSVVLMEGQG